MRPWLLTLMMMASATQAAGPLELFPGTFTNEEDVYFAKEANKQPPPETRIRITREGDALRLTAIDPYGKATEAGHVMAVAGDMLRIGNCRMPFTKEGEALVAGPREGTCYNHSIMTRIDARGIALSFPDGSTSTLRRARPVTCWGSVPKIARKTDGSEDWYFVAGLKLQDQGGRVVFGGPEVGTKPVMLKMRNVVWPTGSNKPSLVLYVHDPKTPDHAISYGWADPDAKRVGINLRWMQASCTIDERDHG